MMKKLILTLLVLPSFAIPTYSSETMKKSSTLHKKTPATQIKPSSDIPDKREFPLDPKVSPCVNFHQYVCGQAEAAFKLRDDRSRHIFAFSDSAERLLIKKREFFKNIKNEKNLSPRGKGLKDNYLACMDSKAGAKEEREWVKVLKNEIKEIKTIDEFRTYGNRNLASGRPGFLMVGAEENVDDPNKYDLYMGVNLMALPDHSYYQNPELMTAYRHLIRDFFIHAEGASSEVAAKKAEAIVKLEQDFIKIYPSFEVRRQRWSEKRTLPQAQFLSTYPHLKQEFLMQQIPSSTLVRLLIPEAMKFYNDLMQTASLELLKDLLFYRAAHDVMDDGYPEFFKKSFNFDHQFFGGPKIRSVREERCTKEVMSAFAKEIDEILLPRLFPNFPEEKFKKVVEKVRQTIVNGIKKNTWLSAEAKKEATEKMAVARLQLVKPLNEREWDFRPLAEYSSSHKLKNAEALAAAEFKKMLNIITEPVNHDSWAMGPLEINAYYSRSSNKFVMPLGILQAPFYNPEGSEIENLGAVGAVVGHELGHGIDDEGSKHDQKGRLRQWMNMSDLAAFSSRSSKLVEQFNRIKHNGKATLGENIGDLVGVTFAYETAFPEGKGSVEDKKSFFQSYARLWCGVNRPQFAEKLLKIDSHALGWARINEPVKHLAGFSEAYQCKEGDPMYLAPKDRVSIW